jgi:hypothetical protein
MRMRVGVLEQGDRPAGRASNGGATAKSVDTWLRGRLDLESALAGLRNGDSRAQCQLFSSADESLPSMATTPAYPSD